MDFDDAYANAPYIPDAESYIQNWALLAEQFRDEISGQLGLSYGDTERQKFDLFQPGTEPKGLFVFVHGGYWLKFDRSCWSHLAGAAIKNGWAAALPSYDLAPQVRISEITGQIAAAICAASGQVDGPIILAGHSAGGHLVARMACAGVLPHAVASRLIHVVPISPVADLFPLMKTSMNADLKLDALECSRESPALLDRLPNLPVTVWVGAEERPVFLEQAQLLARNWACDCMNTGGKHHFDVIDPLSDPNSSMARLLFTPQLG